LLLQCSVRTMSEYSEALRVLGFPAGAQPTEEELKRCMERDALKVLQKPRMSAAYTVLMYYTSPRKPKRAPPPENNWMVPVPLQREPETPPTKRRRTDSPDPETPEKVHTHPVARLFQCLDEQLSRLGQKRWAGDVDWTEGSPQVSANDVTGARYSGSAPLEKLRKSVEAGAGQQFTLELLKQVLAIANGLLSARWIWIEGKPDVLISQNKEILAGASARRGRFGEELVLFLGCTNFPSYALPPRPTQELHVICMDLTALFAAADKFLAECRLLRRPAMPLAEVRQAAQNRTGRVLSHQLLMNLAALSEGLLDFRWARPKFQAPAQLDVAQQGLVSSSQLLDHRQLEERLAAFLIAFRAAASSAAANGGSLPCKEMPPEPTDNVFVPASATPAPPARHGAIRAARMAEDTLTLSSRNDETFAEGTLRREMPPEPTDNVSVLASATPAPPARRGAIRAALLAEDALTLSSRNDGTVAEGAPRGDMPPGPTDDVSALASATPARPARRGAIRAALLAEDTLTLSSRNDGTVAQATLRGEMPPEPTDNVFALASATPAPPARHGAIRAASMAEMPPEPTDNVFALASATPAPPARHGAIRAASMAEDTLTQPSRNDGTVAEGALRGEMPPEPTDNVTALASATPAAPARHGAIRAARTAEMPPETTDIALACATPAPPARCGDIKEMPPETTDIALACATPAPPAKRGDIKAASKAEDTLTVSAHAAYVEQRRQGRVASTLRVRCPGEQKKVQWAEITALESEHHFDLMVQIKHAINKGEISSRDEAVDMRNRLLKSRG